MIVDDNEGVVRAMLRLLRGAGYAVDAVGSAADTFAALSRTEYALVLIDLGLPDADGLALAAAMAKRGFTMPVLLITGAPPSTDELRARASPHLRGVVAKPWAATTLLDSIARVLGPDGE